MPKKAAKKPTYNQLKRALQQAQVSFTQFAQMRSDLQYAAARLDEEKQRNARALQTLMAANKEVAQCCEELTRAREAQAKAEAAQRDAEALADDWKDTAEKATKYLIERNREFSKEKAKLARDYEACSDYVNILLLALGDAQVKLAEAVEGKAA